MNRYECKGYAHKGDSTPIIRFECEAESLNRAAAQFSTHIKHLRLPVNLEVVRKMRSDAGKPRTTSDPINAATGTINPF